MTSSERKIKIGIIGGTGLNKINLLHDTYELECETVFGKPSDKLVCGKLGDVECVLLSRHDKQHLTGPSQVNYRANLLAMRNADCDVIVATTACGSLSESYKPGDLVILDDFIDRTHKRAQSFYDGSQPADFHKICHIPMFPAFSADLRSLLIAEAEKLGLSFHTSGTIVTVEGPRFSSRAESKVFQSWGAHCINMTTCPEVVLAKELGIPYASIAIVTDYDCWRENVDHSEHVGVEAVLAMFRSNIAKVTDLIVNVVPQIAAHDWHSALMQSKLLVQSSIMH